MSRWSVQDAKSRFSELLDTCLKDGPQIVTKRGTDSAVLVPLETWRRVQQLTLKDLLLAAEPRFELELPDRRAVGVREPLTFD